MRWPHVWPQHLAEFRDIGSMVELEPIKGYILDNNRTKTAISQVRLLRKNYLQKPAPPRPFNIFEQTLQ